MSGAIVEGLGLFTVVGSGLIAGVFFAFSTFVMRALAEVPAPEGIRAMQRINVTVINPWFLGAFLGTALTSVGLALAGPFGGAPWPLAVAGLTYALGTFGVTMAFNVPRNEALAPLDPDDPTSSEAWARYLRTWTRWNHVRTVAAAAAMGVGILGL